MLFHRICSVKACTTFINAPSTLSLIDWHASKCFTINDPLTKALLPILNGRIHTPSEKWPPGLNGLLHCWLSLKKCSVAEKEMSPCVFTFVSHKELSHASSANWLYHHNIVFFHGSIKVFWHHFVTTAQASQLVFWHHDNIANSNDRTIITIIHLNSMFFFLCGCHTHNMS